MSRPVAGSFWVGASCERCAGYTSAGDDGQRLEEEISCVKTKKEMLGS